MVSSLYLSAYANDYSIKYNMFVMLIQVLLLKICMRRFKGGIFAALESLFPYALRFFHAFAINLHTHMASSAMAMPMHTPAITSVG